VNARVPTDEEVRNYIQMVNPSSDNRVLIADLKEFTSRALKSRKIENI
jgi:hypothetical protein